MQGYKVDFAVIFFGVLKIGKWEVKKVRKRRKYPLKNVLRWNKKKSRILEV